MILLIRFVDKLETNFLLKDRQVKRRGTKPRLIFNAYPYLKIPMGLPANWSSFFHYGNVEQYSISKEKSEHIIDDIEWTGFETILAKNASTRNIR